MNDEWRDMNTLELLETYEVVCAKYGSPQLGFQVETVLELREEVLRRMWEKVDDEDEW